MAAKTNSAKKGGGKKPAPARKKTKPAKKPDSEGIYAQFKREIWGGICVILAIIVILCALEKNSFLAKFFMGMLGDVSLYVLPIGLLLCAVALIFHGNRPILMRVLCSLGFSFLISALAHLILNRSEAAWNFQIIKTLYAEGIAKKSGGVIGGLLAMTFSLLGGKPVGWAICILLLIFTLPAAVNLTLTGLLRAINNHREELRRQGKEEPVRREPAEVIVERVIQHRQDRAVRRQERRRFDYDLPVDDPDARPAEPEPKKKPRLSPEEIFQMPLTPVKPKADPPAEPDARKRAEIDLPVDEPIRPEQQPESESNVTLPAVSAKQVPTEDPSDELFPEPTISGKPAKAEPRPEAAKSEAVEPAPQPPIEPLPSEKAKPSETRRAAAEIGWQIANQEEAPKKAYVYPSTDLLDQVRADSVDASAEMRENTRRLQEKLACFSVDAQIVNVTRGPNVTMYELQLAQGVRLSKLTGLADDIALELGASGVRISAIPDKNSMVGIEVPNKQVSTVSIREVLESKEFVNAKSKISFAVGKDLNGTCVVGDIAKMPHVLIAGTTGSGKSVCTNSVLISLLYKASPEEVKVIVVDPKMVEFSIYNGIPHLLIPVVTDAKKAAGALQWAVTEMMRRYRSLSEAGVRDIESYNKLAETDESLEPMPKLVVVIDELADLMMVAGKEVEEAICRIAQMGRASGVHLVIATQRPSADVITGLMKANIPSRIAMVVSSAMESRIILDATGAEKLIGKGDMLYAPLGKGKKRVQGCYIHDAEVRRVIDFVKANGSADYNDEVQQEIEQRAAQSGKSGGSASSSGVSAPAPEEEGGDELLPAAVEVILETGMASVSMLQRRLKLGYARAARIVDEMEERGIVGPFEGSKPRALLITKEQWQAMQNGQNGQTQPQATPEELLDRIDRLAEEP